MDGVLEETFAVYGYEAAHVTVLAWARDVLPGPYIKVNVGIWSTCTMVKIPFI